MKRRLLNGERFLMDVTSGSRESIHHQLGISLSLTTRLPSPSTSKTPETSVIALRRGERFVGRIWH